MVDPNRLHDLSVVYVSVLLLPLPRSSDTPTSVCRIQDRL
jgi:hypothetical protein